MLGVPDGPSLGEWLGLKLGTLEGKALRLGWELGTALGDSDGCLLNDGLELGLVEGTELGAEVGE